MEYQAADHARRISADGKALGTVCVTCGRSFRFGEDIACCTACGRFQHVACWEGNTCPHADPPLPTAPLQNKFAENQPAAVTRERVLGGIKRVLDEKDDSQRANICIALVELGTPCRKHLLDIALDKSLDHYTRRLALKIASVFRDEALFEFIRSNCLAGKSKGALSRALGDDEESHSQLCLYITGEEILNTPDFFERFVAKKAVQSFGAGYRPPALPSRPATTAPSASSPPPPEAPAKLAPPLAQETIDAAMSGDAAAVRALLDKGAGVNAKQTSGTTALMWAALRGHLEVAQLLLDRGADVDARNNDGYTALMEAALHTRAKVVRALLDRGADVNAAVIGGSTTGGTPLTMGIGPGPSEVVRDLVQALLDKGADVNGKRNDGCTALILASSLGDRELVQALLVRGADVNARGKFGTALDSATEKGHAEIGALLRQAGANQAQAPQVAATARIPPPPGIADDLIDAADSGDAGAVQALLEQGADANTQGALILAAQNGHCAVVRALLDRGAGVNAQANGGTALSQASMKGHLETVQALLDKGADVNAKLRGGATALLLAAESGHRAVVQALLDRGADVNARTNDAATPLGQASWHGHFVVVQALLESGADVNAKTSDSANALIMAVQKGHQEVVRALLEKGADVNATGRNGVTALILAAQNGHLESVQALLNKGANVNAKASGDGTTALMMASFQGHGQVVQALLESGADANAKAHNGATALMAARDANVRALLVQAWIQPTAGPSSVSRESKASAGPAVEDKAADNVRRMRANRKALETVCVTCRRNFRFGQEVACCSACGRFQHVACWQGNTCPHADSPLLAGTVSQLAPSSPMPAPVAVAHEAAAAPAPADQPVVSASELAADERPCPKCGQIVKNAALKCRFCSAVLNERLAAAEMPAALVQTIASNARGALIYGLLGLVICAPIFASMAISSGNAALREMDQYPLYGGPRGKARAGVVLGWLGWILLGIGILSRLPRN